MAYYDKTSGKSRWEYRTPNRDDENDLMFSIGRSTKGYDSVSASNLYDEFRTAFGKTLDRIHKGQREDSRLAGGRRKITLHSFRRFVKSTISDLGFADFSEFFIGHSGSTYYRKSEKDKAELFKKIEPYLTFLDLTTLQRKGADTQTRIEELEATNQMLRQKDSMNADAIAGLSDQLSKVMQEIELLKAK